MIGIDISGRSIKAVEIADHGDALLRTSCWLPLAPNLIRRGVIQDVGQVAQAVKQALTACTPARIVGGDVVGSIPEVQSFVRVLELPLMSEDEMDEAVQWAVRRHIPFDLDRVYVDWELLAGSEEAGRYQVLVGAAQRDVVDPLLAVLDETGLNVVALELEAQAVVRCLLPRELEDARDVRGALVVDLGALSTNVVFFDQGSMRYTASIQSGGDDLTQRLAHELQLEPQQAIDKKAEIGLVAEGDNAKAGRILRAGALELASGVGRIAQEMAVQQSAGQQVQVVLLSGGGANLNGIIDVFAEVFPGVPVQLGNPWANLHPKKGTQAAGLSTTDALHFTTALGLALRSAEYGV